MAEVEKKPENGTKGTQETGKPATEAPAQIEKPVVYVVKSKEQTEQERTTRKKAEFLEVMDKTMGIIKVACEAIGVGRTTVYRWRDEDPEFRKELNRIQTEQLGEVEDRLLRAILRDESWAISLYLNRVHPKYRPKQEVYNIPTEKTLEDLLDDAEAKNKAEAEKKENYDTNGQQDANREAPQNQNQEGSTSGVQIQQGASVLLGTENAPQPNPESTAKGA